MHDTTHNSKTCCLKEKFIVTIDGSSWTGKSTVSQALAKMLGYQYLNTGSMFRSIAYLIREQGIQVEQRDDIIKLLKNVSMEFKVIEGESHLFVNGIDFNKKIIGNSLISLASQIANIPEIREALIKLQREICKNGGFVIEGRDTGMVVFPDAKWKFFLDASLSIKIKRFIKILPEEEKHKYTEEEIRKIIQEIDERDQKREIAPLKMPDDAILYDNSNSPTAEQDAIVLWYYITNMDQIIKNIKRLEKKGTIFFI